MGRPERSAGSADEYFVPEREGLGELRERASRFIALAMPAGSPEQAGAALDSVRREHHAATHVAFAWRLGPAGALSRRASDAGEPAGTAGRPIASAIESSGLSDAVVAVARYFGGTKLGKAGLARAYRAVAQAALHAAGRRAILVTVTVEVACPFDRAGALRRLLDPPGVRLVSERFAPEPVALLSVKRSLLPPLLSALEAARLSWRLPG